MSNTKKSGNVIPRADIVKHAARLGAEIKNIRLSGDLSEEVVRAINQLLLEHKVIFFRDHGHLDDSEQERFAARLGSLVPRPAIGAAKGSSSILESDSGCGSGRPDQWHMDVTVVDTYPRFSLLRGVVISPYGGDTFWSNTATAYRDLPAPLRMLADDLWAVHSNRYDYVVTARTAEVGKKHCDDVFTGAIYEANYPVVRIHPETGARTLFLGSSVQRFVGLQEHTGQKLFDLLQSYVTAPENCVHWSWKAGDVAIWDNRATEHYAVREHRDQRRVVRRVGIDADVPLSVDGPPGLTRVRRSKPQSAMAA